MDAIVGNYTLKENKSSSSANPIKQPYRIAGKTVVVIHESLVREFKLEEDDIWFEQIGTKDGIFLKLIKDNSSVK